MRIYCDRCGELPDTKTPGRCAGTLRRVLPYFTACGNVNCAHSFTAELTLGHTISPSALDLPEGAAERMKARASPREVRQLLLPLAPCP